jgi:beta-N-acetylhexosaminidase
MKIKLLLFISFFLSFCSAGVEKSPPETVRFSLNDFYQDNPEIDAKVRSALDKLGARERIGQMIITSAGTTGKPRAVVENLIRKKAIGGVLMLSGEKEMLKELSRGFDSLAVVSGVLPLIYSSDAEPSLINRKIKGTQPVPNTVDLGSPHKSDSVAAIISDELLSMNIRQNFAPVLDLSAGNEAITNRTFGNDSARVVSLASAFIRSTQAKGIIATAKHFPGHGLVSGDTHNRLVTIDGEMREAGNYKPIIAAGVISIMVGHIAVINNERFNTDGLPSSCSRAIVTDLLKKLLGFEGIVVTDAMNMGALKQVEQASLKAVEAGCDMILMEPDELQLLESIYARYESDALFREQVDESVRKILRLKVCLNLM